MGGIGGAPIHRKSYPDKAFKQLKIFKGSPTSASHLDIEPSHDDMPMNPMRQQSAKWIGWGHKLEPESLFHYNSLNELGVLRNRDRERVIVRRHNLWYKGAFRPLTYRCKRYSGRSVRTGQIVKPEGRFRGGRVNWRGRNVDMRRQLWGIPGTIIRQEYCPIRSARINLVRYPVGHGKFAYSYILANQGVDIGDKVVSGPEAPIAPGNALPIERIPPGTEVSNVEHPPGQGAKFSRAAGTRCVIIKHQTNKFTQIKLPSGELRLVYSTGYATIGPIGNPLHKHRKLGFHRISRFEGFKPHVRGMAMENAFHPHGGSHGYQGRSSQGPGQDFYSIGQVPIRLKFN